LIILHCVPPGLHVYEDVPVLHVPGFHP
jgi:hypothetical protein